MINIINVPREWMSYKSACAFNEIDTQAPYHRGAASLATFQFTQLSVLSMATENVLTAELSFLPLALLPLCVLTQRQEIFQGLGNTRVDHI